VDKISLEAKIVDGRMIVALDGKVIDNTTLPEGAGNVTVYKTADGNIGVMMALDGKVIDNTTLPIDNKLLPEGAGNVTVYRTADGKTEKQASAALGGVCLGEDGEACAK